MSSMKDKRDTPVKVCSGSGRVEGRPCGHPQTFHGTKRPGPCRALGCRCAGFVEAEPLVGAAAED